LSPSVKLFIVLSILGANACALSTVDRNRDLALTSDQAEVQTIFALDVKERLRAQKVAPHDIVLARHYLEPERSSRSPRAARALRTLLGARRADPDTILDCVRKPALYCTLRDGAKLLVFLGYPVITPTGISIAVSFTTNGPAIRIERRTYTRNERGKWVWTAGQTEVSWAGPAVVTISPACRLKDRLPSPTPG
jgi:hypothetical protein